MDTLSRRKEKKRTKEIFEVIMTENLPDNVRHQTTDPGNAENIKEGLFVIANLSFQGYILMDSYSLWTACSVCLALC